MAAAGALALGGRLAPAATPLARPDGDYGPFKVGLQSYSLRHYDTAEALAKTKGLGLHFWESYSKHTNPDPAKAAAYKSEAAAMGVRVAGFGVSSVQQEPRRQPQVLRVRQGDGGRLPLGRPGQGRLR